MPDFTRHLANADDETIRAALDRADLPALLPALAAATGDLDLVPDHLRKPAGGLLNPGSGLGPAEQAEALEMAFAALARLRDENGGRPLVTASPDEATMARLLLFATGGQPAGDYLELLEEELNIGNDPRTPAWRKDELASDRPFTVAIIGAGMSGLVAAHRLAQAGLDFVVLDKNADVGGTWFDNQYPGCRVDVSNLFYSYSFAQRDDWPEYYSSQPVLLEYFRSVTESSGIRDRIRFNTEVTSIEFDESSMTWTLQLLNSHGREEALTAHAVVSAVGQLNRPSLPKIAGRETFAGPAFHSAQWDPSVSLEGKRVAVIGTGASAVQFIPKVAAIAGHLTVFQRTPAWFIPSPSYTDKIIEEVRWLRDNVPGYTHWSRFLVFWGNVEGMMPFARVDASWTAPSEGPESVSAQNDFIRQTLTGYLQAQFNDRPDLLEKIMPTYAPFSKRFILDDGAWASALKRDNVALVIEKISEIAPSGVRTADGELHEVDVLIYGTGFQASDFLAPMKIVGRGGVELHEWWAGDARAYLGITVPSFPNLYLMYGPNTNIVVNGSITYFSECEVQYILGCIKAMLTDGIRGMDVRPEVHDAYNEKVDAENLKMAWGVSSVNTWYKNATGRTAQNWPFSLLDYWRQTRQPDLADYELL